MSKNENKEKYLELKAKYNNQAISNDTLEELIYWSDIIGMEVNSIDQPQCEYGVVVQHYVVSYEEGYYSDNFNVTFERNPNKAEEQQLGCERD